MRALATLLIALSSATCLLFSACASHRPPATPTTGDLSGAPASFDQWMANDALGRLAALYPPAKTVIALRHGTDDAFGRALVPGLRSKGYAVSEAAPPAPAGSSPEVPEVPTGAIPMEYVIDQVQGLYRVTLVLGNRSLSRMYAVQGESIVAAGPWARKE